MLIFRGHVHVLLGGDIFGISFSSTIEAKISLTSTVRCQVKHLRAAVEAALKDYLGDEAVTFHQLEWGEFVMILDMIDA